MSGRHFAEDLDDSPEISSEISEKHDSDEPPEPEPSKVYHRAITSLYAGTSPEASRLNGKVRVLGTPKLP